MIKKYTYLVKPFAWRPEKKTAVILSILSNSLFLGSDLICSDTTFAALSFTGDMLLAGDERKDRLGWIQTDGSDCVHIVGNAVSFKSYFSYGFALDLYYSLFLKCTTLFISFCVRWSMP